MIRALPLLFAVACLAPEVITEADTTTTTEGATQAARVCINELMVSREGSVEGVEDTDWLELHALEAVDFFGWTVRLDTADASVEWSIGGSAAAGDFVLLTADDDPVGDVGFKLPAEGGALTLLAADGSYSAVSWGETLPDMALARTTDCCEGDGCWTSLPAGTPGASNEGV